MSHPDEDLPVVQLSLKQFVSIAQNLFNRKQDSDAFVRFVLAGRIQINNQESWVFINARQGEIAPPVHKYQLRRDVDSAIGMTHDLPFRKALGVFPVASWCDTLTEDNHLKYTPGSPLGFKVSKHMDSIIILLADVTERYRYSISPDP